MPSSSEQNSPQDRYSDFFGAYADRLEYSPRYHALMNAPGASGYQAGENFRKLANQLASQGLRLTTMVEWQRQADADLQEIYQLEPEDF